MWPYHPELLARAVPRYTSYPTAAEFTPSVGAEDQLSALRGIAPGTSVSLYVHIPFCKTRCRFCEYTVLEGTTEETQDHYVDLLLREMELYAPLVKGKPVIGFDTLQHFLKIIVHYIGFD